MVIALSSKEVANNVDPICNQPQLMNKGVSLGLVGNQITFGGAPTTRIYKSAVDSYCGWTKSCTTLKAWETIVYWNLQGKPSFQGSLGAKWSSSIHRGSTSTLVLTHAHSELHPCTAASAPARGSRGLSATPSRPTPCRRISEWFLFAVAWS